MSPHCDVVDEDDERLASRERPQKLAERHEGAMAGALRLVDRRARPGREAPGRAAGPGRGGRAPAASAGSGRRPRAPIEPHQVAAERVDDAVDRLVRDRLALVGAAAKDEGAAAHELVEEVLHEGRLAHARRPGHAHGDRCASSDGVEGALQGLQRGLAADERGLRVGVDRSRWESDLTSGTAHSTGDVGAAGTLRWIASEERSPERVEIAGRAVAKGLVENDPDAVPVAGLRRGRAARDRQPATFALEYPKE